MPMRSEAASFFEMAGVRRGFTVGSSSFAAAVSEDAIIREFFSCNEKRQAL
jgi:hypothetical protein